MIYCHVDTVFHVYESNNNLHIICGISTGETDVKGADVFEKNIHLTMPMGKAARIIPDIAEALPKLRESDKSESAELSKEVVADVGSGETEGVGLHFRF